MTCAVQAPALLERHGDSARARDQPRAKGEECRIVTPPGWPDQVPGFSFGNGQLERRNEPACREIVGNIGAEFDRHAKAIDGGLQGERISVEPRTALFGAELEPRRLEPERPVLRGVRDLEQRLLAQVGGFVHAPRNLRGAYGKEVRGEQDLRVESRPVILGLTPFIGLVLPARLRLNVAGRFKASRAAAYA